MSHSKSEANIRLAFDEGPLNGARIKVIGIGGGGGNAVNCMIEAGIDGVEFIAANTDLQALRMCHAPVRLQLGSKLTKGLGVGANPELGRQAALEDTEKIIELLEGADMVFLTAGLGGGTGTGAAPIVAGLASELSALTVAVVTKPFAFEGKLRMKQAQQGLDELKESVDAVITIPNERLLSSVPTGTSLADAFKIADDVLRQGVQGISDLIIVPGVINLDFADVKTVMTGMGMALMGTGVAEGEDRAALAARKAINSPLLEDGTIKGARAILINITGSRNMTLHEVSEASWIIQESADPEANIIFGSVFEGEMDEKIKITVIATGFDQARGLENETRPSSSRPRVAPTGPIKESPPEMDHLTAERDLPESKTDLEIPTFLRRKVHEEFR